MLHSAVQATSGAFRFARQVLSGGHKRHRAMARYNGERLAGEWARYVRRRKAENPARDVIAISLVEHLGDIVAAEPISRVVRSENPDAWIVWIVRAPFKELIQANPNIDDVLVLGCLTEWMHATRKPIFDKVVDLHIEERYCPACYRLYARKDGNREINIRNYYHHGNLLEVFSKAACISRGGENPRVYIPPQTVLAVDRLQLNREFVVLHCKSTQVERDWTDENWQALAERIRRELGISVVEVGLGSRIKAFNGYTTLCGRTGILETAEVIRRANLFIGIDSGPAHIANAVGTPGVILLGAYRSYKSYMPYSGGYAQGQATILRGEGPASGLNVDEVFRAVESRLKPQR